MSNESPAFTDACRTLKSQYGAPDRTWASWGDYDRKQLLQDWQQLGLASMLAGVGLTIAVYRFDPGNIPLLGFCILVTALVFYTHRGNLARMAAGTENRARRLWLFRSRAV